jgi:hypothetical protein
VEHKSIQLNFGASYMQCWAIRARGVEKATFAENHHPLVAIPLKLIAMVQEREKYNIIAQMLRSSI